ncbi:MAG TPA: hypothetical protein VK177_04480 [Flavobacteriales bacterium]|nr:hypothetical protein [Flavobacteriales bacterium]
MKQSHDFGHIKSAYQEGYNDAIKKKIDKLPTTVENWFETLNQIEFKFLSDIKWVGVLMYPYYPIGDLFADFGNPFKKVAVVIEYKNHDGALLEKRINSFREKGWTVYTLESKSVTYTAEELFDYNKTDPNLDFYEIPQEEFVEFVNLNKAKNSQCLLYYIRFNHFDWLDALEEEMEELEQ